MATITKEKISTKDAVELRDGIPRLGEYLEFVLSKDFKRVEEYSNSFIEEVGGLIGSYNKRWVKDPLHQWSRQWEYPYIISKISEHKVKNLKVLDIGSGITFLPYYLEDKLGIKSITALDYDKSLERLYGKVNKIRKTKVDFIHHDMRELRKLGKEEFDFIYSVSVLEHTDHYDNIIKQCYKLLKPGGKLSLTFDISLDNQDDIPVKEAIKFLKSIDKTFKITPSSVEHLKVDLNRAVTSHSIGKLDKKLMPWKYPFVNTLKPALKLQGVGSPYKQLTFCCVTVEKISD